jgi:delta 1-pyrroline-5-carboxylate dehydrogenase
MLENTLIEWEIESVFTIIASNATVNDVVIDYMRRKFKDKRATILEGEFLHMRCAAHMLNLVVNEGLKRLGDCVSNIRNAVKFVRSSPQRMKKFKECIKCEKKKKKKSMYEDGVSRCSNNMDFYVLDVEFG